MKRFFTAICILVIIITFGACSSQPRQPRQPRQQPQQANYGTVDTSNTNTFVNQRANSAAASLGAESMKIWSRPLELGFEIKKNAGKDGYIDEIFPKDEDDILRMTENDTYFRYARLQDERGASQTDRTSSAQDMSFNNLPALAQSAILAIIKDYNLDGFYVTMIEEFTGTIETKQSTGRTIPVYETRGNKKVQTGTQQEIKTQKKTYKQVRVRGIALKIKLYDPVNEERSDAVRKEEAGAPVNYIYR